MPASIPPLRTAGMLMVSSLAAVSRQADANASSRMLFSDEKLETPLGTRKFYCTMITWSDAHKVAGNVRFTEIKHSPYIAADFDALVKAVATAVTDEA